MEKLFSQLPLTIQQAKQTEVKEQNKLEEPLFAVKKYNAKRHIRTTFYKPITKIISIRND